MLKSIVPVVAALGFAALAGQALTTAPAAPGQGAAGWHLLHEGAMAKLAYGLPDSDQVALMLTCSPGDRAAVVYGDVQPRSPALTPIAMGPQPIDPLSDGEAFEARLPLTDAALTGLARGGRIAVQTEGGDQQIRASRAERRMVQGFLSYCASSHA
ncbi:hypothetical protein ABE444_09235 [Brevundimonas pondensis]|uniref:Uncharacterized protein n=1 Tax=Brevundimonas pondensis TaxID=2774189 RepID=A0ABX7SPP5_9CAUL|nr:hypothetical protein [Brevundimonas pondensis]QTC88398.1 hypothetical protein IFE19_03115 [Brevundimonas pondensis]